MKRRRKRGGTRYRRVQLSLPKRLYSILNGITLGDERKLNRLIRAIIEEKLREATVYELESYISKTAHEEEITENEEVSGDKIETTMMEESSEVSTSKE